jgi:riboflavin kinase/FMN adenylyltransferase
MKTYTTLDEYDPRGGCILTVGIFDGFHLGHRRIVETTVHTARARGLGACAMTFHPHPRRVLRGERLDLVTSIEHRLLLLERAGIDTTFLIEFTSEFASASAEGFVAAIARDATGARALVLGPDAHLGAGCGGDVARIATIASRLDVEVVTVEPVTVGGEQVSSTRVREAIGGGDLALAASLLGRRVSVFGTVVYGQGVGRRLGFPTANLDVHREVRPPLGVYATWAMTPDGRIPSVTNVGYRPTFADPSVAAATGIRPDRLIEAHLLTPPAGELYGRQVELEFVRKLREERRFGTDAELVDQIARDVAAARAALEEDARG